MKQVTENVQTAERAPRLRLRSVLFAWVRYRWEMRKLLIEKQRTAKLAGRKGRDRDLQRIHEKLAEVEFTYLSSLAARLRVPLPDRLEASLWYVSGVTGHRCLTEKALADFRADVQRAKDDRWQFWPSN
jgi:hypothetical protein